MNNRNNGLQRETGGKIVFEDMHCMNIYSRRQRAKQPRLRECLARCRKGQIPQSPTAKNKFHAPSALLQGHLACGNKNGSNGARTHDLSRVRRTLIPAELCFHVFYYSRLARECKKKIVRGKICLDKFCLDKFCPSLDKYPQKVYFRYYNKIQTHKYR